MWYRKVVSFGGGVDFSRNKSSDKPYAGVDIVKDIDNHPQGLYDELPGILKKMNKNVKAPKRARPVRDDYRWARGPTERGEIDDGQCARGQGPAGIRRRAAGA